MRKPFSSVWMAIVSTFGDRGSPPTDAWGAVVALGEGAHAARRTAAASSARRMIGCIPTSDARRPRISRLSDGLRGHTTGSGPLRPIILAGAEEGTHENG